MEQLDLINAVLDSADHNGFIVDSLDIKGDNLIVHMFTKDEEIYCNHAFSFASSKHFKPKPWRYAHEEMQVAREAVERLRNRRYH